MVSQSVRINIHSRQQCIEAPIAREKTFGPIETPAVLEPWWSLFWSREGSEEVKPEVKVIIKQDRKQQ
jgi:hypothetical protein